MMNPMKKLLLLLMLSVITQGYAQINWMSFEDALAAQSENPKKIIVDVYTNWCGPCKLLDRNTFQNEQVAAFINENYYAVKFNAEGSKEINYRGQAFTNPNFDPNRKGRNSQHEFAAAMNIRGYPSIVFFDEDTNFIQPVVGYKTPRQLEIYLKMISNDDYKELTTAEKWQEYQENFEYSF